MSRWELVGFAFIIPVAALGLCLVFLASATGRNLIAGAVALVAGLVIYRFRRPESDELATTS